MKVCHEEPRKSPNVDLDRVCRFGGLASMDLPWPEDAFEGSRHILLKTGQVVMALCIVESKPVQMGSQTASNGFWILDQSHPASTPLIL